MAKQKTRKKIVKETQPLQLSGNVLQAMRIHVADKKLTLKELAETAIMNHIK